MGPTPQVRFVPQDNGDLSIQTSSTGITWVEVCLIEESGRVSFGNAASPAVLGNWTTAGAIQGDTITADNGIVVTAGGALVSAGDIDVTLGNVAVAAGNITATLGNIAAPAGSIAAGTTVTATGGLRTGTAASIVVSTVALTNGAGVGAGTIATAPAAGEPTKWIGIDDNGTVRYVPAW